MRPAAEAFGLGLLHGPAELLPVSSSAHLALLGHAPQDDVAVAMHAGTALALIVGLHGEAAQALRRFDVGFHLVAGAIPSAAGVIVGSSTAASGGRRERGAGSRAAALRGRRERGAPGAGDQVPADRARSRPRARIAAGMLAGSLALAWADRAPQERPRDDAGLLDAAVLGLAQACALWPGVSRSGATLAAARARRFTRPAAAALSREIGVPLLLGAAAYSTARGTRAESVGLGPHRFGPSSAGALAGAVGSFAGTLAALPLLALLHRPLWPWSAYRAGIALALVGRSR